ncbi:hypothetical protein ABW19_dt0209107 [Dactylella cylindrospora]|nr:hypothetical protein ABW19_dt0209107 [Dactylella cylindrospora]
MPIAVPRNKKFSDQAGEDGTTNVEKHTYDVHLLWRGEYASLVASDASFMKVFFQNSWGELFELHWERPDCKWLFRSIAKTDGPLAAALYTPLSAIMWEDKHIRLYYLSPKYELRELCIEGGAASSSISGGKLNESNVVVASYSGLSACCWSAGGGVGIRLYYQGLNDRIEEYCYGGGNWVKGATLQGDALPGSSLAFVNRALDRPSIRGYWQDADGSIREHVWESGWKTGQFGQESAPYRVPLAATVSNVDATPKIRLYRLTVNDTIREFYHDGSAWQVPRDVDSISVIPGARLTACSRAAGGDSDEVTYSHLGLLTKSLRDLVSRVSGKMPLRILT